MKAICRTEYRSGRLVGDMDDKNLDLKREVAGVIYYDIYGVWFYGELESLINEYLEKRFKENLGSNIHAYVNVKPSSIATGVHDLEVYGHRCRLYKWMAQGCHRGLIVLENNEEDNKSARRFMESGTWSWILK